MGKRVHELAVKELLKDSNTNFDSLIKNIENNEELYDFVKKLVLDNENISYIKTGEIIDMGSVYGNLSSKIK